MKDAVQLSEKLVSLIMKNIIVELIDINQKRKEYNDWLEKNESEE